MPHSKRKDVSGVRDRWALKFRDREAFGKFCVALREEKVPFSLPGAQTIAIAIPLWKFEESPSVLKLYQEFRESGSLEEHPITAEGKRRLTTPQEAESLLQKLTTNLRSRKYAK